MANYCTECGKELIDGEVCGCQKDTTIEKNIEGTQDEANVSSQTESVDIVEVLRNISNRIGKFLDSIYDFISPAKRSGKFSNLIPVRNLLGFSQEDRLAAMGDCYERNKKIVPDLVQPCGQEKPIRQYELCSCRSLVRGLWQEGRLQVTNKRVLFRLSGRNWVGKALTSVEYSLDEVAGVDIKTSNKLSLVTFLINIVYMALFSLIGLVCVRLSPELFAILAILLFVAGHILVRRHYYFKLGMSAFCLISFIGGAGCWKNNFWTFLIILSAVLLVIYLFISSLKPSLDFSVLTKCNTDGPIQIKRESIWEKMFVFNLEVLPGKDAIRAMDEVGTMVNDIQKFGDFGIEKWKEEN